MKMAGFMIWLNKTPQKQKDKDVFGNQLKWANWNASIFNSINIY